MVHIDLFSGIGGFALAVDEVFGKSEHIFCEIDSYCQALLKKRFKGARVYGDIRTLSRERLVTDTNSNGQPRGGEEVNTAEAEQQTFGDVEKCYGVVTDTGSRQSGVKETGDRGQDISPGSQECFILTGGFPCQPFSQVGKRKGTDDNRYLWPEMLRVIRDFKPKWVIAENVRGILTIEGGMVFEQVCLDLEGEGYEVQTFVIPAVAKNAPHRRDRVWFVAYRSSAGLEGHSELLIQGKIPKLQSDSDWSENWLEVATQLCGVDDGLPAELDGLKLSQSRHRVERLKALGNAIVPQVAVEIMRGIKYSEETNNKRRK